MSRQTTINAIKSGVGNLAGRLSGLVREVLISFFFGTSAVINNFAFAFALPQYGPAHFR